MGGPSAHARKKKTQVLNPHGIVAAGGALAPTQEKKDLSS